MAVDIGCADRRRVPADQFVLRQLTPMINSYRPRLANFSHLMRLPRHANLAAIFP
jgi:hypothetical protein